MLAFLMRSRKKANAMQIIAPIAIEKKLLLPLTSELMAEEEDSAQKLGPEYVEPEAHGEHDVDPLEVATSKSGQGEQKDEPAFCE